MENNNLENDNFENDNLENNGENAQNSENNFENFMQMFQMMQMFSEASQQANANEPEENDKMENKFSQASAPEYEGQEFSYGSPIFEDAQLRKIRAIKAVIPYLEPEMGRRIGSIAKFMEIKTILDSDYEEIGAQYKGEIDQRSILRAIRPHCDESMTVMAEMIEKALEMQRMMEIFKLYGSYSNTNPL